MQCYRAHVMQPEKGTYVHSTTVILPRQLKLSGERLNPGKQSHWYDPLVLKHVSSQLFKGELHSSMSAIIHYSIIITLHVHACTCTITGAAISSQIESIHTATLVRTRSVTTKLTADAWLTLVNVCANKLLINSTDTVYLYLYSFVHLEIVCILYYTHKQKSQEYYCILVHTHALSLGTRWCLQNEVCSDYIHMQPSTLIVRYIRKHETDVILGLRPKPMWHCYMCLHSRTCTRPPVTIQHVPIHTPTLERAIGVEAELVADIWYPSALIYIWRTRKYMYDAITTTI